MNFLPKVSFNSAENKGAELKKTVVDYCDKNDNAVFGLRKSDNFEKSGIINKDFEQENELTDTFETLSQEQDEEYYTSGTIPVAVIDVFDKNTDGVRVCNMMKSVNPEISITKFEGKSKNSFSKTPMDEFVSKHPLIDNFLYENKMLKNVSGLFLSESQYDSVEKCLGDIAAQQKQDVDFKAVNMPIECNCPYSEINRLVIQETNVQITPENIEDYKSDIKHVFDTKRSQKISSQNGKVKIAQVLNIVKKTEELNIPVYMAGSYNEGDEKGFNLFALANNAKYVEVQEEDGDASDSLASSVVLAKDMEKYLS